MYQTKQTENILSRELAAEIDQVIDAHHHDSNHIVDILLDVQQRIEQHYIPRAAAYYIADRTHIRLSVIYDCLTFYDSLSEYPRAKYPIQICDSIACHINNNQEIFQTLKQLLGIELGEVTYDGRFTLEKVPCFGACDMAPAVRINGKVYGHLEQPEKIAALLRTML